MPVIANQLRQYATAMADPTRGMILTELERAGELTATQLARRLDLSPNNVYHHMRVLLQLEVVDPPRAVPGETYVEKYYHINPQILAALRLDPEWYERVRESLTVEDRQAIIVSICMTMSHLLRQAARDFEGMDATTLDRYVREERLVMLSINRVSREQLTSRLAILRDALTEEDREFAEDLSPQSDLMLIAALPLLWSNEGETDT